MVGVSTPNTRCRASQLWLDSRRSPPLPETANRRDLAERKREPCGFYARLSVKPETQVGLAAPVVRTDYPTTAPHPVRQPAMQTMQRKLAVKLERLAALPSL